jgi:hypothetical protein
MQVAEILKALETLNKNALLVIKDKLNQELAIRTKDDEPKSENISIIRLPESKL